MDVPCNSFSKISVSGTDASTTAAETPASTCPSTSPVPAHGKPSPRVIKIRRFRNLSSSSSSKDDLGSDLSREDGPGHSAVRETVATAQLSHDSSQESDPNVVNGEVRLAHFYQHI